jgi:HEAT repeat protein
VLAIAAARPESEAKELAQTAFDKSLAGESAERLKKLLKHEKAEVRAASARSIGQRELRLGGELIDALSDASPTVQQAARGALVRLSGGRDFGPETDAGAAQGAESIRRWRAWWSTAK